MLPNKKAAPTFTKADVAVIKFIVYRKARRYRCGKNLWQMACLSRHTKVAEKFRAISVFRQIGMGNRMGGGR